MINSLNLLSFFSIIWYSINMTLGIGGRGMVSFFVIFALFILYLINTLTDALCNQKEIPVEKQPKVFRTINILMTILLTSTYVKVLFT